MPLSRAVAARGVAMFLGVLLTWVVTRLLTVGPDKLAVGAWSVIYTAMFAVATVTRLGAENLAVKLAASEPARAKRLIRGTLGALLLLGLVAFPAMIAVTITRESLASGSSWLATGLMLGCSVIALNVLFVCSAWLRGLGKVALGIVLELGVVPGLTVFGLTTLWLLHGSVSLTQVLVAYSGATFLTCAVAVWAALSAFSSVATDLPQPSQPVRDYLREHGMSLTAFTMTGLGFYLYAYLPVLVFGAANQDAAAAEFRNSYTLASFVNLVPTLQIAYLTPTFARLYHHGRYVELRTRVWLATRNATAVGIAVSVPLLIFPHEILGMVFGSAFAEASGMLRTLVVSLALVVAFGPTFALAITTGLERIAGVTMALVLVAGFVLMLLALPVSPLAVTMGGATPAVLFAIASHHMLLRRRNVGTAIWNRPSKVPTV
jgi:O-antigen/teichoic acid export membrane protein